MKFLPPILSIFLALGILPCRASHSFNAAAPLVTGEGESNDVAPSLRDAPSPDKAPVVVILTSTYRQVNNHSHFVSTTAIVKKAFESGAPSICLNTREGAGGKDPARAQKKETLITYTVDGEKKQIIVPESQTLDFKKDLK